MAKGNADQTLGRPIKPDRDDIILSNGLSARQWKWIKKEAANKMPPLDAAQYHRFMVDMVIAAIEKSRADIEEIAAEEDEQFDKLVRQRTSKSKSTKE